MQYFLRTFSIIEHKPMRLDSLQTRKEASATEIRVGPNIGGVDQLLINQIVYDNKDKKRYKTYFFLMDDKETRFPRHR
jgi:hypothetical protein